MGAMVGVMNGQAFGYLIGASFDDYASNAAMQVIFKEPIPCDGSDQLCEAGQTSIPAQSYLSETLHIHLPLWVNLCVLFLFIVAPRLLAYIVLRRKKAGERE